MSYEPPTYTAEEILGRGRKIRTKLDSDLFFSAKPYDVVAWFFYYQ